MWLNDRFESNYASFKINTMSAKGLFLDYVNKKILERWWLNFIIIIIILSTRFMSIHFKRRAKETEMIAFLIIYLQLFS